MKPKQIPGVPEQNRGGYHDTESYKCFEKEADAQREFTLMQQRFLNINRWEKYAGEGSASLTEGLL